MLDGDTIASLVEEMRGAGLDDARLRERLALMVSKLAVSPSASFPKVFDPAELEAAYRFFGNVAVTPDGILKGHYEQTRVAAEAEGDVLVVHDSTTFSFDPDGEREGLGRVRSSGQAFFGHFGLVLSADGSRNPLGLCALQTWTRGEGRSNEKSRWRTGVELAVSRLGNARAVHVMDREADDYALFSFLAQNSHQFVIRVAHDRLLQPTQHNEAHKISEALLRIDCEVERKSKLSQRVDGKRSPKQKKIHPARQQRTARLAIGATMIVLQRPRTQSQDQPSSLSLNLVRVWEPEPIDGEPAVEWWLLTNQSTEDNRSLERIVDQYRARWTVEEYFKALKTGCAYSTRQLADYEGLVNALAVFAPIACRALTLRTRARLEPTQPALRVLQADELQVLRQAGRTKLPAEPTTRDVLLAVAALGGHIKWNGEPGWLTILRGLDELLTLTKGWRLAKLQPASDQ